MATRHRTRSAGLAPFPLRAIAALRATIGLALAMAAPLAMAQHPGSDTLEVHADAGAVRALAAPGIAAAVGAAEPHAGCHGFWLEGAGMSASAGEVFGFAWPPTGTGRLVLRAAWAMDDGAPADHFLAGPFALPPGHYEAFASNDLVAESVPARIADAAQDGAFGPHGMPRTGLWVDACQPVAPVAPLPCPSGLAATPRRDGSVGLAFAPVPGSDGTNVYRAAADGPFVYLGTAPAGSSAFRDAATDGDDGGASYRYGATALQGFAESAGCPVALATAAAPSPHTTISAGVALGSGIATCVAGLILAWSRRQG